MLKYVTDEEVLKALDLAARMNDRSYLVIKVLALSGIRVSELVELTPQDVNSENTFSIKGKGGKIRTVDVPAELVQLLSMYVKQHKIKKRQKIIGRDRTSIYLLTKKLTGKSPHSFRHGYAIQLLRKTGNIRYVQKQLGHSSLSTTQVYLQFIEYDLEKTKLARLYQ